MGISLFIKSSQDTKKGINLTSVCLHSLYINIYAKISKSLNCTEMEYAYKGTLTDAIYIYINKYTSKNKNK